MRHIHDSVLVELEHDRLLSQSAAFVRRLREEGTPAAPRRTGAAAAIGRFFGDDASAQLAAVAEFDGYSCGAEMALAGSMPLTEVIVLARHLQRNASQRGALRAVAFAHALAGEAALYSGFLRLAAVESAEAAELHHANGSAAGQAHALRLLALVRLAEGDGAGARRLLDKALPQARWSRRARHLVPQVFGSMIVAAPDLAARRAVLERAESNVRVDSCAFCVLPFNLAALTTLADAGELDRARAYSERIWASMRLWAGTTIEASVSEALAHLAAAEGAEPVPHLERALAGFDEAGRPLDLRRVTTQLRRALAA